MECGDLIRWNKGGIQIVLQRGVEMKNTERRAEGNNMGNVYRFFFDKPNTTTDVFDLVFS
jgi:hypothetical protein